MIPPFSGVVAVELTLGISAGKHARFETEGIKGRIVMCSDSVDQTKVTSVCS